MAVPLLIIGGIVLAGVTGAIKTIVDFLTEVIHEIHKIFLTIMHGLKQFIGELLGSMFGGMCALLVVFLAVVLGPQIVLVLEALGIVAMFEAIYLLIDTSLEWILVAIHWRELMLVNDILQFIWDDYRALFLDLHAAIGSFSRDLAYDSGFLSLAFRNARNIVYSAGNLVGIPKEYMELEALEKTSDVLKRMEKNFHYYAANPERALKSIDDHIVYPYVDQASDVQARLLETVGAIWEMTHTTIDNFNTLKENIDQFIADLPDEINSRIYEWYAPISDAYDDWYANDYLVFKEKVDYIEEKMLEYRQEVQHDIDIINNRLEKPISNIAYLKSKNKLNYETQLRLLACLNIEGFNLIVEYYGKPKPLSETLKNKLHDALYIPPEPPKILSFEAGDGKLQDLKNINYQETWYVGDY